MNEFNHKREHVRQLSLVVYAVMLAMLMPLTIFLVEKEQDVRTEASSNTNITKNASSVLAAAVITPSFYPLAPCPSCTSVVISPITSSPPAPSAQTPSTSMSQTPADPCVTGGASTAHSKKKKHKSKHKSHDGEVSKFMKQILEWLIELINKLLGEGTIKLPDENTVPAPSSVPNEEDTIPDEEQEQEEEVPCPDPSTPPVPSTAVSGAPVTLSTAPSVVPSQPVPSGGAGTTANVKITFYGAYDNDPKGSKAIANPVIHQEAGGTGTHADPLTFASPAGAGAYKVGQIIYVPLVQKYFIKEDECAVSWTAPNGCGAVTMVDIYVGNPSDAQAVVECENSITPSGDTQIIIDPPANLTVDPNPIWNQSTGACMTPH